MYQVIKMILPCLGRVSFSRIYLMIDIIAIVGGCGAMFDINVVAPEFKGLNTVKQHRIINEVKH